MSERTISCDQCRDGVSALLDGEDPGCPSAALHAHLAGCATCCDFEGDVARLHRASRVMPAPDVPDLTPRVLAAIDTEPARSPALTGHLDAWRAGLALVAIVQIALAIPALLLGSDAGLPVHTARHLGSFDAALGIGFLVVAWKPSRVPGLIPVIAALVACLVITSAVDVASGRAAALGELTHVTELLGLALCVLIARGASPPRATRTALVGRPA